MLTRLAKKETRAKVEPLVRHDFQAEGGVGFAAACFGGEDTEWSLAPLQSAGDEKKSPQLAQKVREAMRHLGADRVYAPNPVYFNGRIIHPLDLLSKNEGKIMLGEGVLLFRDKLLPADGTFLRSPGDAGIFSAAGCSVIAASYEKQLLFAHAGRDCVINRRAVLNDPSARPFESVVDSIVQAFFSATFDPEKLKVWVLYSIRPEHFLHPYFVRPDEVPNVEKRKEHEEFNKRVGAHLERLGLKQGFRRTVPGVEIDVPEIAKLQFMQYEVPEKNIDLTHAYLEDELPTTRNSPQGSRYLVAIARTS